MMGKKRISVSINKMFLLILGLITIGFVFNNNVLGSENNNVSIQEKQKNNIENEKEKIKEDLIKLDNIFKEQYKKEYDKYNTMFYNYDIDEIINKINIKYNTYRQIFTNLQNRFDKNSKKYKIIDLIDELNKKSYDKIIKNIKQKYINKKDKGKFELSCAYDVIKKYKYEEKYKNAKGYINKEKVKKELKDMLYSICGNSNIERYKLDNDKKIIMSNILDDFSYIKIFPAKNNSLYNQKEIKKNKIDINKNPLIIKFPSLVGQRNLNGKKDYHGGIDITLSALNYDMRSNYKFLLGKIKSKEVTSKIKKLWKELFHKTYKDLLKNKGEGYTNYKNGNKLYIEITPKYFKRYNCYLGINKSRYSNRIVGFGYFLLCINKKETNAIVLGHLSSENYNYLINKKLVKQIADPVEKYKLGMITGKGYEENYYGFNKKEQKWNYPYQQIYYGMTNSSNLYYKIIPEKTKESLILKYGTTGHSYGEHIHMSNIILDGNISSIILDNGYLEKAVQKMFGTKKIDFTSNHFFFLSSL